MSESKCFCHLNGYEVKDAKARRVIESLNSELKSLETDFNLLKILLNSDGSINSESDANYVLSNIFSGIENGYDYYSSTFIVVDDYNSSIKLIEYHSMSYESDSYSPPSDYVLISKSDYEQGFTLEANKVYHIEEYDEYGSPMSYWLITYDKTIPSIDYIENRLNDIESRVSSTSNKIDNIVQWRNTYQSNKILKGVCFSGDDALSNQNEGLPFVIDSKERHFYIENNTLMALDNTNKDSITLYRVPVRTRFNSVNYSYVRGYATLTISRYNYSNYAIVKECTELIIPDEQTKEVPEVPSTTFTVVEWLQ